MITVPSLDPCTDILDTDEIMITHQNGTTDTISGANFNKRTQIISASSKTITGTPLKPSNVVRVFFTADITGSDTTTALALTYNGTSKNVKVPKDGSLVNFTAQNMGGSPVIYKYLQAYTTLNLLYDGTNFIIIDNPAVIKSSDYIIYADGNKIFNYPKPIVFYSSLSDQMWGYFIKCNTRVFCHIQFHLTSNLSDWQGIANVGAIPKPKNNIGAIPANGKTGSPNSIYIFDTGIITQAGGGGMPSGDYTFDFDYEAD